MYNSHSKSRLCPARLPEEKALSSRIYPSLKVQSLALVVGIYNSTFCTKWIFNPINTKFSFKNALQMLRIQMLGLEINPNNSVQHLNI